MCLKRIKSLVGNDFCCQPSSLRSMTTYQPGEGVLFHAFQSDAIFITSITHKYGNLEFALVQVRQYRVSQFIHQRSYTFSFSNAPNPNFEDWIAISTPSSVQISDRHSLHTPAGST